MGYSVVLWCAVMFAIVRSHSRGFFPTSAMSILQLYLDGEYHKIVLISQSCVSLLDCICLYLSLAGLGRREGAVTLLKTRLEEETDPGSKLTLLRCIYGITGNELCQTEIKYWESLNISPDSDSIWDLLNPLPPCDHVSAVVQVSKFVTSHAFIHPESYSYSVLQDYELSRGVKKSSDILILKVVERCGAIQAISERVAKISAPLAEAFPPENPEFLDQVLASDHLTSLQHRMVAIACAYLQGDFNRALEDSLLYIKEMTDIRQFVVTPYVRGLLDFDIETLCMICSQCVTHDTPERILDYLLRQLLDPGEVVSVGDYEYSRNELRSPFKASQLRRSSFFLSCGHIFRAKAFRASRLITVHIGSTAKHGSIFDRNEGLEMTRKYVIAAALQPLDNPMLHEFYDQVIWSLLLCGRIHLHVLWFFFVLRITFYKLSFFSFSEPCKSFAVDSMNPNMENMSEVFERFYDICEESSLKNFEGDNLLPTLVEVQKKVYLLAHYTDQLKLCTLNDEGNLISDTNASLAEEEVSRHTNTDYQIVELWTSVYKEIRDEIPIDVENMLQSFKERPWSRARA